MQIHTEPLIRGLLRLYSRNDINLGRALFRLEEIAGLWCEINARTGASCDESAKKIGGAFGVLAPAAAAWFRFIDFILTICYYPCTHHSSITFIYAGMK